LFYYYYQFNVYGPAGCSVCVSGEETQYLQWATNNFLTTVKETTYEQSKAGL